MPTARSRRTICARGNAGRVTFIDFHLVVPGDDAGVERARDLRSRSKGRCRSEVADAMITIHVEPEEKAKHHGVLVL